MSNKSKNLRYDLTWTEAPRATDSLSGMSESLADGLVTRFVREWTEADGEMALLHPPPQTIKRAAGFRRLVTWLNATVPNALQLGKVKLGDQTGLSKDAMYFLLHFAPGDRRDWMEVAVTSVGARKVNVASGVLVRFSRHALVRLFQRLKTVDPAQVVAELAVAIRVFWTWRPLYLQLDDQPRILAPTPRGALVLVGDMELQGVVVAKTWLSDERMSIDYAMARAVGQARDEGGFVLMADRSLAVVSSERLEGEVKSLERLKQALDRQLRPSRASSAAAGRATASGLDAR